MPTPVRLAEFGRIMGVDRSQPTRWVAYGMPTLPDGRVDAEAASEWVRAHIDPTAARTHHPRASTPDDPVGDAVRLGMGLMSSYAPHVAAEAAVAVGISLPLAQALYRQMADTAADAAARLCAGVCGMPANIGPSPIIGDYAFPVDWQLWEHRSAGITGSKPAEG